MAEFKKGRKKTGGRKKGVKNRTTCIGKETIANYFETGGLDELLNDIDELEPRDKVNATALREAEAQGKGAASLNGKMIDAASERMADNVIAVDDAIRAKALAAAA